MSELRLRQDREEAARQWEGLRASVVQRFADVVELLGAEKGLSVQSVDARREDVEVNCQVQAKERTALLTGAIAEAGFDV